MVFLTNSLKKTVLKKKQTTKKRVKQWIGYQHLNFQHKIVIIFLPINFNICFGCSKEPSHWDGSFEYPQHMFWLRNNKIKFSLRTLNWSPASCWGRESWLLYFNCVVAVCVLCFFLMVSRVGLWSVIVAFLGHTHKYLFKTCSHPKMTFAANRM